MAYIGRQLARGENKLFDDISSSFNGSTTTFTLAVSSVATATATPYQLFVSLGGVMQKPNTDFTTAGNQITFTTAPAAGLSCWIMMQGDTIDNAAVADASITPSKISGSNFAFSGDLRLKDADGSHYVGFASPTTVASNKVWTLPAADGTASQYLQTNGSGVLSWATVSIGGATGIDFNDNVKARWGTGNDLEIFHNSSNSVINDAGTGDLLLQVGGATKATVSSTGFDITGALTVSTNATITGNLTVSGTTTTINTQTLDVEDKNVVIGKVSSPSDTTADGGGWTLKGASDKTFNWINATDAWTSSEHIHLIDNKKLLVGGASGTVDGLEIVHNGSNSILNDSGTGTLQLQLGGSTKLEVTSGGINVTGAISVGGSPLSTAPTITATADGAIAANKACCVNTNGSVSQIAETTTPSSIVSRSTANTGTGDYVMGDVVWITATDFIAGGRKNNDSNKAKRFYGKVNSGGTITLYGEEILGTNYTDVWNTRFATDTSTEIFLTLLQIDGDNSIYIRAGEVNSNQTGVDFGAAWWVGIGTGQYASAVASNNNGEYMIGFIASDNQMHFKTITVNTSTLATTQSSSGSFSTFTASNTENTMSMIYVPSVGMYWAVMVISGQYMRSAWIKSNGSSSAPTCTTDSGVLTGGNIGTKPWLSLDPSTGKVILSYRSVNSNRPAARVLTITGSSSSPAVPTFSSETQLTTGSCDDIRHTWARDAASGNGKAVFYIFGDDSHIKCYTLSGTTLSDANNNLTLFTGHYQYSAIDANPSTGRVITATRDEGNSNRLDFNCIDIPLTTTNWTSENFVGFSAAAYSDTNTATINVVGNTTTQSSLTPAQKYYVQTDGTIALTADSQGSVFAGTALSSTKLLVKG